MTRLRRISLLRSSVAASRPVRSGSQAANSCSGPLLAYLLMAGLLLPGVVLAWGAAGHKAAGVLAVERAGAPVQDALAGLLGTRDPVFIAEACNWPDLHKFTSAGYASEPLHWVNLDPQADAYRPARDCPQLQCLPEAVREQAARLADAALPRGDRQLAFAFLCHYVVDLHQPMHVGFAADHGGNLVTVTYQGHETNLHMFWDVRLIAAHAGDWLTLLDLLRAGPRAPVPPPWRPTDITDWTNETFTITRYFAYPDQAEIDRRFEADAWKVARNQLATAADRLAAVLRAVLESEPAPD